MRKQSIRQCLNAQIPIAIAILVGACSGTGLESVGTPEPIGICAPLVGPTSERNYERAHRLDAFLCRSDTLVTLQGDAGSSSEFNLDIQTVRKNKLTSRIKSYRANVSFEHNEPVSATTLPLAKWQAIDGTIPDLKAYPGLACLTSMHRRDLGIPLLDDDHYGDFAPEMRRRGYDPAMMNFMVGPQASLIAIAFDGDRPTKIEFSCFQKTEPVR